ncbi:MAG: dienelactone hydrolase family protein [Pseudomonadota bacterium]
MKKLSGPIKLPITKQNPDKMVVFLHGVGADGNDLISLFSDFETIFPNAVFLSPNAPFPYDMFPSGYQWFSLANRSADKLYEGIETALPILKNFLDENLELYNLEYKDLILVGFSQGTMMALEIAPRFEELCYAVIGFSGALVNPSELSNKLKSYPQICLIHGAEDQVVPAVLHKKNVKELKRLNIPLKECLINNLGHSINGDALKFALDFLKDLKLNENKTSSS